MDATESNTCVQNFTATAPSGVEIRALETMLPNAPDRIPAVRKMKNCFNVVLL
jgi:hypothetical protein